MYQIKQDPGHRIELVRFRRTFGTEQHRQHKEIETGHPFRCTCQPKGNKQTCQVHLLARYLPEAHH